MKAKKLMEILAKLDPETEISLMESAQDRDGWDYPRKVYVCYVRDDGASIIYDISTGEKVWQPYW